MKLMTFSEINDLENGQQIPALQGRVKKVFDQKTGEGNYGIWWLQSFILTDEHGVEIQCTWSCEDTVNELEGKEILIESGRDKKDQLAGIKKEIKTKNGKRYETVKLDDRCTIRKVDGDKPELLGEPGYKGFKGEPLPIEELKRLEHDWPEAPPLQQGEIYHPGFGGKPKSSLDERQRAIIRQHSQSMALEVLKLKVTLNELTVSDLTPSKLKTLADYFDKDVLGATQ